MQTGHSLDGVALSYGMKALRHDEIKRLAGMVLPSEWEFGCWEDTFSRLRQRRSIRKRTAVSASIGELG
ncbi:hypothetical protein [Aurantimonas manganoxydans]|uniref:hypothetical protein n=1 Tax=Aurantimonas manganoxydans TaxID=651183 RepID=UPI001AECD2FA|nr:hypothetical protein [Aurantimonas manganoxydans]